MTWPGTLAQWLPALLPSGPASWQQDPISFPGSLIHVCTLTGFWFWEFGLLFFSVEAGLGFLLGKPRGLLIPLCAPSLSWTPSRAGHTHVCTGRMWQSSLPAQFWFHLHVRVSFQASGWDEWPPQLYELCVLQSFFFLSLSSLPVL